MEPDEREKLGKQSEAIVDHFSRLPECIIHQILSLLEAEDAVVTSVLSKTWHQWFSSFPYVDCNWDYDEIQHDQHSSDDDDDEESSKLLALPDKQKNDFLNQVESSLQGRLQRLSSTGTHICRFKISIVFHDLDLLAPRMDRLVALALEGNVKELDLDLELSSNHLLKNPHYNVPQSVLLHKTLTILNLTDCTFELEGHNQLDIIKLPHLRMMEFYYVIFRGLRAVQMFENLAASFPSIEDLKFRSCDGLNSIRSVSSLPQLKHVVLNHFYGMEMVDILSPNLLTFSFNPPNTSDIDMCEVNLPVSLALKELMLSRIQIGASLQKLMSELSGVLEVLKLYLCVTLENISISVRHLKELLLVDCSNLSIAEINNPPPNLMTNGNCTFRLHKVHIVFPRGTNVPWSKWKDFLMKSSVAEDLKLVIRNSENIIVHENLTNVSVSWLCQLQDLGLRIWISSICYPDLVNKLLFPTSTKTLSAVCFRVELTDLLMDDDYDYRDGLFGGFEMDTPQDQMNPPALKCFLKEHSTGRYNSTTFKLKWKGQRTNFTTDRHCLNYMFIFFKFS